VKQMGERSAGNPHAAFDVEGAGNVARSKLFGLNRRASPRPYLCGGRPVMGVPTAIDAPPTARAPSCGGEWAPRAAETDLLVLPRPTTVRMIPPRRQSIGPKLGRSLEPVTCLAIAVGTPITGRPPGHRRRSPASGSHRTWRADFPHHALRSLFHSFRCYLLKFRFQWSADLLIE